MSPEQGRPNKYENVKGRKFNNLLLHEVIRRFYHEPATVDDTIKWLDYTLREYFQPTGKHPTVEDTFRSILLAGCTATTELLIGTTINKTLSKDKPKIGRKGCYVVKSFYDKTDEDLVLEYPPNSAPDEFMRMAVPLLVNTGIKIGIQALHEKNPLHQYRPVWELEYRLRKELSKEEKKGNQKDSPHRPSQIPEERENCNPFAPGRLKNTNALFMRNVMHYLILITEAVLRDNPAATREDLIFHSLTSTKSAEIAAQYSLNTQRARMGIPGGKYDEFRKQHSIIPEMYLSADPTSGSNRYVIRGLEAEPNNPSMCSGAIIQGMPSLEISGDSAIRELIEFGARIAQFTLWKDIPTRDKKVQVIYDSN